MVGLIFFFEDNDVDVWSGRDFDLDAWNYAALAAGDIDRLTVVNRTDEKIRRLDFDFHEVATLKAALALASDSIVHVCTPREAVRFAAKTCVLWDFDHDVEWYAFGPAAGWSEPFARGVTIPQAAPVSLHSTHAASIVLAHRYGVTSWR